MVKAATRALQVWMNGEHVGTWLHPRGGNHSFAYARSWLASSRVRALSLSLPITPGIAEVRGQAVQSYFENLLPDSEAIRRRLQSRFRTRSIQAFELLSAIGRDCVGAVQLLPDGVEPTAFDHIEGRPLSDGDIERHLVDVTRGPGGIAGSDSADDDAFRISIAGAQEKTAFLRERGRWCEPLGMTPTTHIFKLPLGMIAGGQLDLRHSVENEWLCLEFLRECELPVAQAEMRTFGEQRVLVVERFDRQRMDNARQPWIARLPQEDLCQATGTPPAMKYEAHGGPGIARCLAVLGSSSEAALDKQIFAGAQMANWLLAAPDGHAKNYSIFLLRGDAFEMTPLYDVLSAWPLIGSGRGKRAYQDVKLAMGLKSRSMHHRLQELQTRHWHALAMSTGVDTTWRWMCMLAERAPAIIDGILDRLPAGVPAEMAEAIATGIKRHARVFQAGLKGLG